MSMPDRLKYYTERVRDRAGRVAHTTRRVAAVINEEIAAMNNDPLVRRAVDEARLHLTTSATQDSASKSEGQVIAADAVASYAARRAAGLRGTDVQTAQALEDAAGALAKLTTRYVQRRRLTSKA